MIKVTDLEEFALAHIVRPYQDLKWGAGDITKLPCSLDELVIMLGKNDGWAVLVLARIRKIGFRFPPYIQHKIADLCVRR